MRAYPLILAGRLTAPLNSTVLGVEKTTKGHENEKNANVFVVGCCCKFLWM
jgi:hypothetical protein